MSRTGIWIRRGLLVWVTFVGIFSWLPLVRGAFDGVSYQWGTRWFGQSFAGVGVQGDYWLPLALAVVHLSVLFLGWRRPGPAFGWAIVAWSGLYLADALHGVLSGQSFVFHGDTLGIRLDLTAVVVAVPAAVFALAVYWALTQARRARRIRPGWGGRRGAMLMGALALFPIEYALLAGGPPHGTTDAVGVILTMLQWALLSASMSGSRAEAPAVV